MFFRSYHSAVLLAVLLGGAAAPALADEAAPSLPGTRVATAVEYDGYQRLLDGEAREALRHGDYGYARHLFQLLVKLDPRDARAHREVGRTSHALAQFEQAIDSLRTADQLAGGARDPELHYLLGEALYAVGRTAEARKAHERAAADIGEEPSGRMETLWLARIHARAGRVARADELYDSILPHTGEPDEEISLSRAEAHILAGDWAGAETILRDFLAGTRGHPRATDMLAWVLEAQGKVEEEKVLRGQSADHRGGVERLLGHARALERSYEYDRALARYREVEAAAPGRDPSVPDAIDRMRYRLSPELTAGAVLRSDPTGDAQEWRAGGALPLGARHSLALLASYETARSQVPVSDASTATIGAGLLVGHGYDLTGVLRVNVNYHGVTRYQDEEATRASGFNLGSAAEVRTAPGRAVQFHARADLHMPWREAANTIREGGIVDGLTAHLYVLPFGHRVVIDSGIQARRMTLAALDGGEEPEARQVLLFGGADVVLWSDPTSTARGEILDEELLWPTYLADALVLSYRHYEAFSNDDFGDRIVLVDRASIDELSATARKALPGGAVALEMRGGGGYDRARELRLWRAGGALLFSPWTFSRLTASYDLATESTTGLVGRRHTGWITLHVDL